MTLEEAVEINVNAIRSEAWVVRSLVNEEEIQTLARIGVHRFISLGMLKVEEPKEN